MMGIIRGVGVDAQGRCVHYRSLVDVIGNRCATCGDYFACHLCHAQLADHDFGRMPVDAADSLVCGACGHQMGYADRQAGCPSCGHFFNPGCHAHDHLYFLDR